METSQKAVKDIAKRDNETIEGLLESMIHLVGLLNISYQGIQDFSKFVPNIITEDILDVSFIFQDPSLPLNKNKIHIQMNHFMELVVATRQILIKTPFHGSM